jgi:hypothetical protein
MLFVTLLSPKQWPNPQQQSPGQLDLWRQGPEKNQEKVCGHAAPMVRRMPARQQLPVATGRFFPLPPRPAMA